MQHDSFLEHLLWLLNASELRLLCDEYEVAERPKQRETIEVLLATPALQTLRDCLSPLTRSTLLRLCEDLERGVDTSLPKQELLSFMLRSLSKFKAKTWEKYAPIPLPNQSFTHESTEAPPEHDLDEIGKKKVSTARYEAATKRTLVEVTQLPLPEIEKRLQLAHGNTLVYTLFEDAWPELETALGIQQAIDEDRRSSGLIDVIALTPPPSSTSAPALHTAPLPSPAPVSMPHSDEPRPSEESLLQEERPLHTLLRDFHQALDEIESIHAYKYQENRPVVTRYLSRGSETFGVVDASHHTNPITPQQLSSAIDRLKTYRKRDVRYIAFLANAFTPEALAWLSTRKVLSEYVALYEVTPKGFVIRHNKRKRVLLWTLLEHFLQERMPLLDASHHPPLQLPTNHAKPVTTDEDLDAKPATTDEDLDAKSLTTDAKLGTVDKKPIKTDAKSLTTDAKSDAVREKPIPPTQPPPALDDFNTGGSFSTPSLGESLEGGRYRLEKLLGQGGMGRVFAAYDQFTKRHCALKLIHPHLAQDPKIKERFLHEISILHTLQHPCVVRSYDVKEDRQRAILFYTMEWIDGTSLSEKLHKQRGKIPPLPLQESLAILEALVDALDYIHKQKVVHRDLKPANIMLTPQGRIKMMDFGIAVTFSHTHVEAYTSAAGTPHYLAPEQLTETNEISPAADIFALGVLTFHLLTGLYPPRRGETKISTHLPQASPALDSVIQRATHDDPAQRYPTAKAFWQDALAAWPHDNSNRSPSKSTSPDPFGTSDASVLNASPSSTATALASALSAEPSSSATAHASAYTQKPPIIPSHNPDPSAPTKEKESHRFQDSAPHNPSRLATNDASSAPKHRPIALRFGLFALSILLLFGSGLGVWFAKACPKGQARCEKQCVALAKTNQHCGKCGQICDTTLGFSCKDGTCACSPKSIVCGGRCVDTKTHPQHCGACGQICPLGATCKAGRCLCPRDQSACDGRCVDLQTEAKHCGRCNNTCALGCAKGVCKKRQQLVIALLPKATAQRVEAGQFTMGLSKKQLSTATYYESPPVQVSIQHPFWIWKTEVTQAQFQSALGYNPARFKDCGPSCPVEQVNWHEATAFCNRLSVLEKRETCFDCKTKRGRIVSCAWKQDFVPAQKKSASLTNKRAYTSCKGWRLPTEAEWEYAARGGHKQTDQIILFPISDLLLLAWVKENSAKQPHPVAQKQPNPLGLFDMLGNLREWTAESIQRYPKSPQIDPQSPPRGSIRAVRGGSWYESARSTRLTKRASVSAAYQKTGDTGFRPVRTLDKDE